MVGHGVDNKPAMMASEGLRRLLIRQLRLSRVKGGGIENSSGKHRSFLDIIHG